MTRLEQAAADYESALNRCAKALDSVALPPERLPVGCVVRVAGEWARFDGVQDGRMLLESGTSGWSILPAEGETFIWSRGSF